MPKAKKKLKVRDQKPVQDPKGGHHRHHHRHHRHHKRADVPAGIPTGIDPSTGAGLWDY